MEEKKTNYQGNQYNSDPSALTTSQLLREINSLKELVIARIDAVENSIKVAHDDMVRVPTEVQKQVSSLKELLEQRISNAEKMRDEKFVNVDKGLALVEQARLEQKKDTSEAFMTALKTAKEQAAEQNASNNMAIAKSEVATQKQIDQMGLRMATIEKTFEDKFSDVKERITKVESSTSGITNIKDQISLLGAGASEGKGRNEGYSQFIGWILAAIAIIGFLIMLANYLNK